METYPTWIRLHPDSTDDTMVTSVQARIHDPLWLLGRQWQFGELRHDGGATPIDVRVDGTSSPLTRLRGGITGASATGSVPIKSAQIPLETLVERETVPETGLDNLRLRTEAGLQFVRMMRAAGMDGRVSFWVAESPFVRPDMDWATPGSDGRGRPDGAGWLTPRVIRARLAPEQRAAIEGAEATSSARGLRGRQRDSIRRRADHRRGIRSTSSTRSPPREWERRRSGTRGTRVRRRPARVVTTSSTAPGHWATGTATPRRAFRIPAPLDFAGMPNPRFWTFENPGVRFDQLALLSNPEQPPSPATLMVLDFALSYSDDWFLIPIALDAWTIYETTAVAITDVFGDTTFATPPDGRWNMFRLDLHGRTRSP